MYSALVSESPSSIPFTTAGSISPDSITIQQLLYQNLHASLTDSYSEHVCTPYSRATFVSAGRACIQRMDGYEMQTISSIPPSQDIWSGEYGVSALIHRWLNVKIQSIDTSLLVWHFSFTSLPHNSRIFPIRKLRRLSPNPSRWNILLWQSDPFK